MKDTLSEEDQAHFDHMLTNFVYCSNISPYIIKNEHFRSFIRTLRPKYRLPSRKKLETTLKRNLLECLDAEVKQLQEEAQFISISSDGWSSRKKDHFITTLGIFHPGKIPLFLNATMVDTNRETAEYLAQFVKEEIEKFGVDKVSGFVIDNAANFKAALAKMEVEYPNIFFGHCASHSLNLFVKLILTLNSFNVVKRRLFALAKESRSGKLFPALLKKYQMQTIGKTVYIPRPCVTRWTSVLRTIQALLLSKNALKSMTIVEDYEMKLEIKLIIGNNFSGLI